MLQLFITQPVELLVVFDDVQDRLAQDIAAVEPCTQKPFGNSWALRHCTPTFAVPLFKQYCSVAHAFLAIEERQYSIASGDEHIIQQSHGFDGREYAAAVREVATTAAN
jgi:hypothetical protein